MKNFTKISLLSFMIVTFAIAEEAPKTPGISIHEMFTLRQMWEDLQNNSKKDLSFNIRPNDICFRNNERNQEVCIHKAILAEMFLEAVKTGQTQILADLERILTKFKQTNLPEFNIEFQVNNPKVQFDKNYNQIIDPNNKPFVRVTAATPTGSFKAESNTQIISPREATIRHSLHADEKIDIEAAVTMNPKTEQFIDYMLRMKNLERQN